MCDQANKVRVVSIRTTAEMEVWLEEVRSELRGLGWNYGDLFAVRLALEEAIVNAIKHGHGGDTNKEVRIRYSVGVDYFLGQISDQGPGFDPGAVPDPLQQENIEREGGRGLLLIRSYMTWMRHNKQGNSISLCKKRGPEEKRGS
jgi:serine/threonine-protein kinase RsbW